MIRSFCLGSLTFDFQSATAHVMSCMIKIQSTAMQPQRNYTKIDKFSFQNLIQLHKSIAYFCMSLSSGATQGVLQDVNLPDNAGGYSYRESARVSAITRNRFIYWYVPQYLIKIHITNCTCNGFVRISSQIILYMSCRLSLHVLSSKFTCTII